MGCRAQELVRVEKRKIAEKCRCVMAAAAPSPLVSNQFREAAALVICNACC